QAGHDVAAALHFAAGGREHGVSLADAGRSAEKNFQVPPPFFLRQGKQGVRRRAGRFNTGHAVSSRRSYTKNPSRICVRDGQRRTTTDQDFKASSARFNSRTLTRGSPSRPKVRPATWAATRSRTCASPRPLAFATRGAWK